MRQRSYGVLCPISHACEVLGPRWTIQILTELWNGLGFSNGDDIAIPKAGGVSISAECATAEPWQSVLYS